MKYLVICFACEQQSRYLPPKMQENAVGRTVTYKTFWDDPYLRELDTRVSRVAGSDVVLERTIFYAFSGGQEGDSGTIGGKTVRFARIEGQEIIYTLDPDHHLGVGELVRIAIDWDRRFKLMRLHFAAEIILVLVHRSAPGIEKIGAHISAEKARIDFVLDRNISLLFPALEREAKALVDANREIVSAFSGTEGHDRYWEISEFSRVRCGGTHIRKTGEIGRIALKRKNIGRAKERIEITLQEMDAGG